jgi:phage portal protein BeeE
MMMLELREFDEARIAIALGVQPHQLGLPQGEGMTYSNANAVYDYHWRSFLRPATRKIAAGISGWALVNGQELRFNPEQYVRPPLEQRVPAYQALVEMGVLTAEEVRVSEDLVGAPPEQPGDTEQEVLFG